VALSPSGRPTLADDPLELVSSATEFHSPQSGHLPIHLLKTYPQLWQTKLDFGFVMGGQLSKR
jgi:hypothetical protein